MFPTFRWFRCHHKSSTEGLEQRPSGLLGVLTLFAYTPLKFDMTKKRNSISFWKRTFWNRILHQPMIFRFQIPYSNFGMCKKHAEKTHFGEWGFFINSALQCLFAGERQVMWSNHMMKNVTCHDSMWALMNDPEEELKKKSWTKNFQSFRCTGNPWKRLDDLEMQTGCCMMFNQYWC